MKKEKALFLLLFVLGSFISIQSQQSDRLDSYVNTIEEKGVEPTTFVIDKFDVYDLILFDDGLHTAVEPFEFYEQLVENKEFQNRVKYIFLEVVSVNQQPSLDAFFNADTLNLELLYPAFQNDFSGTGWPYSTYFDLLQTIWYVNSKLPDQDRFKVIAVNAPTYWKEINTPEDVELFRLSLTGNDYTMYKIIKSYLNNFRKGDKGIFLTNTRHAYKGIKSHDNEYYLNCGTFFHLYDPGKTYSVRFHNINLYFEGVKDVDSKTVKTTEGLENVVTKWVRMENGLWDNAFELYGNTPVAFDIAGTPFGEADYIGNHMLNVLQGQKMQDAYDAIIFLVPVDEVHQTAMVDFIYTDDYKRELVRRAGFLYEEEQINEILSAYGFEKLSDFIDSYFIPKPSILLPESQNIGSVDEWKLEE